MAEADGTMQGVAGDRIVINGLDLDTPGISVNSIAAAVAFRSEELAKQRDAYCRQLLEARMPRRLHWLIDRPRLLKRVLRAVPRWQPTLTIVPLSRPPMATGGMVAGRTAAMASTESSAKAMADVWMREQALRGREIKGVVFTYTDVSGLPAEVYA